MEQNSTTTTVDDMDDGPAFIETNEIIEEYELGDAPVDEVDEGEPLGDVAMSDEEIVDMSVVTFTGHSDFVYCVAVHPTQYIALSGGGDDKAYLWSTNDGSTLHELVGHTDSVVSVGFSSDGRFAATGGYEGVVKVWNVSDGSLHKTLEGPTEQVEWIQWHKKGNVVVAGSSDGTAWMWLADTGACMQVFAGHEGGVTCGAFTGSGKMLVTGSEDGTVRLWNPKNGNCVHVFQGHDFHEGSITTVVSHPTDPLLLTGSQDGTARLCKLDAKRVLGGMTHSGLAAGSQAAASTENDIVSLLSVETVAFCFTNPWVASGGGDGDVRIWETAGFQCRLVLSHDGSTVVKTLFHPNKPMLFTVCADGALREWDARSGQCTRTITGHSDMLQDFVLRVGGATPPSAAATGGEGGGEAEAEAGGDNESGAAAAGGEDLIVTCSDDNTCRVFHV